MKKTAADLGLTDAENAALKTIRKIIEAGEVVTTMRVSKAWKNKDRTYVYRVLMRLIEKKAIETYANPKSPKQHFYRLTKGTK